MTRLARPLAVGFISAGTLAYEILLVRIFAIEHFHHFAYMAIGIAMLGFGTSGTLIALWPPGDRQIGLRWFRISGPLTAASLIVSPILLHRIAIDPTRLAWDAWEWARLAVVYLILALPFALGALAVLLALTVEAKRPGWIYGTSLIGSGIGATVAVGVLWWAFPERALALPAVVTGLGALAAARTGGPPRKIGLAAWLTVAAALWVAVHPAWHLQITPYKGLPQVEAYPDARRVAEHTSPLGWVVAVDAPAFRYAPGLSLAFQGTFPSQQALFVDAEMVGAIIDPADQAQAADVLHWLPTALPYATGTPESVLIVAAGGGSEVRSAVAHGARRVTAVELHPDIVRLAAPTVRTDGTAAEIDWVVADARSFIARSREVFDVITIAPSGGFRTGPAGVHSLSEDFLHTVEAYEGYLGRLADGGVFAVTRWIALPPRETVRSILTAARAVRPSVGDAVARSLVVVRSWGTATVLVKPSGFTPADIGAIRAWAATRRFDVDWPPGLTTRPAFNLLEEGTLVRAATAAAAGVDSVRQFISSYAFDVAPVRDANPYPHHFIRTGALVSFFGSGRESWLPFAEWGQIALFATLIQTVLLAGALTLLPVATQARRWRQQRWLPLVGYFAALGLAYMAAEIAAIQQLALLLGHPVYAVAAVLGAFLMCSGVGSLWSDRLATTWGWAIAALLSLVLAGYAAALLWVVHWVQSAHIVLRAAAAAAFLAPLAFLMGLPFPMGIRLLGRGDAGRVAWGWASNGFASVVATPLAAIIALEAGSPALFVVAALAYGTAAVCAATGGGHLTASHTC